MTIPEGVVKIEAAAFQSCVNLKGTLSLPTTLEYLGDENSVGSVFDECGFTCELKLPDKLKYIGNYTFNNCQNLYGSLILPENLEYIGLGAFQNCRGFTLHPRRIFPAGRAVYLGQRHQEPGLLRQSPDSHRT